MYTIIGAIISAAAAIAVCIINSNIQHRTILAELDKHNAVLEERIKQLERKQDKHNSIIERTYRLEQDDGVIQERIKVMNHRISDLENEKKIGEIK